MNAFFTGASQKVKSQIPAHAVSVVPDFFATSQENWSQIVTGSGWSFPLRFFGGDFSEVNTRFPSPQTIIFTRAIGLPFSKSRIQGHFLLS